MVVGYNWVNNPERNSLVFSGLTPTEDVCVKLGVFNVPDAPTSARDHEKSWLNGENIFTEPTSKSVDPDTPDIEVKWSGWFLDERTMLSKRFRSVLFWIALSYPAVNSEKSTEELQDAPSNATDSTLIYFIFLNILIKANYFPGYFQLLFIHLVIIVFAGANELTVLLRFKISETNANTCCLLYTSDAADE